MSLKRRYRDSEHLGAESLQAQIHTLENRSVESPTTAIQWNPSITATIGEQHNGRYTGVAVVEGFCV